MGMDGAHGTGCRDGEETRSSLLLEGQELQPARVCGAAGCGWVWRGDEPAMTEVSSALSRTVAKLSP